MRIFNFHPVTLVLLGAGEADSDPKVADNWLVPAWATAVAPPDPVPAGKVAVFDLDEQVWSLVDILEPSVPTPALGDSTSEELAVSVIYQRDMLLQNAALRIAPLQDAVDLAMATPEQALLLNEWKQYRVKLGRVEEQESYPDAVTWPGRPDTPKNEPAVDLMTAPPEATE